MSGNKPTIDSARGPSKFTKTTIAATSRQQAIAAPRKIGKSTASFHPINKIKASSFLEVTGPQKKQSEEEVKIGNTEELIAAITKLAQQNGVELHLHGNLAIHIHSKL